MQNINNLDFSHLDLIAIPLELNHFRRQYFEALWLMARANIYDHESQESEDALRELREMEERFNRETTWSSMLDGQRFWPRVSYVVDVLYNLIHRLLWWERTLRNRRVQVQLPPLPARLYNWSEDDEDEDDVSDDGIPSRYSDSEEDLAENWMPVSPMVSDEDDDDLSSDADDECWSTFGPEYLDRQSE